MRLTIRNLQKLLKKTPKRLKVKKQMVSGPVHPPLCPFCQCRAKYETQAGVALIKHLRHCLRGTVAIFGPFIHKSKRQYYIRSDGVTGVSSNPKLCCFVSEQSGQLDQGEIRPMAGRSQGRRAKQFFLDYTEGLHLQSQTATEKKWYGPDKGFFCNVIDASGI